jgi:hypothetical protein
MRVAVPAYGPDSASAGLLASPLSKAGRISVFGSRTHSEYSLWGAATGCTTPDSAHARLGQPEMAHFPLLHQRPHGSGDALHWHLGIGAVLVKTSMRSVLRPS